MLDFVNIIGNLLSSAILAGGVLAIAGVGETVGQRAGVYNLGLEGFISLGAVSSFAVVYNTGSLPAGCLAAALVGLIAGAMFATATVLVKVNQVICGLAFLFLGLGVAAMIGADYAGQPSKAAFTGMNVLGLAGIPGVGKALFGQPTPVYFAYLIVPVAAHFVLFRTRIGINLRAVGENPSAADATGVPVERYRFWAVVSGSVLATCSGAYLTLVFVPSWSEGIVAGRGWIALALVIFASFRPLLVSVGALLFSLVTSVGYLAQARGVALPSAALSALPYLATLAFMLLPILKRSASSRRLLDPPAALGVPYYREER